MHSRAFPWRVLLLGCFMLPICQAQTQPDQTAADQPLSAAEAEALIDGQIAAYNARDLERFLGYYSDQIVLVDYPDQVTDTGKEAIRTVFEKNFENPHIRASIAKRIVFGNFVIDHEQLTHASAPGMFEAVVIYEIQDGKIARVTFLYR